MKFSTAVATTLLAASATNANAVEKRDVVTNYVHVTKYVYEQAHVYVDENGNPVSTSYELVSTELPVSSTAVVAAADAPVSTEVDVVSSTGHQHSTTFQTIAQVTPSPAAASSSSSSSVVTSSPAAAASSSSPAAASPASSAAAASGTGQVFSGDATYYAPGLGACGITNTDTDFIAALNKDQWGNPANPNDSPFCGQKVKINRGSATVTVTITDKCPGCNYGDLDLSPAAFDQIAQEAEGRVPITWQFI